LAEILLVRLLCYAELAFDGYRPLRSLLEIPGAKEIGVEFRPVKDIQHGGWRVGVCCWQPPFKGCRTLKTNLNRIFCGAAISQLKRLCSCLMFIA